ncbi:protein TALPID3 [Rhinophrynus dorsalis]
MAEEGRDISWDSEASSTASDVLIRSTSIHRAQGSKTGTQGRAGVRRNGQTGAGCPVPSEGTGGQEGTGETSEILGRGSQILTGFHGRSVEGGGQQRTCEVMRRVNQVMTDPHGRSVGGGGQIVKGEALTGPHSNSMGVFERNHTEWVLGKGVKHMTEPPSGSLMKSGQTERVIPDASKDNTLNSEGSRVQISLTRLREIPAPFTDFALRKQDAAYIPPALPANKYPAVKLTLNNAMAGKDIQISQFATGQKEVLLSALNKRSQSGPVTKKVRVQLLEDKATVRKEPCAHKLNKPCTDVDSATTVAAATAAAIAAAAPILKVQSDMEAQVNSVSQLLNKLQEADRQLQHLAEQQRKIQNEPPERQYPGDRVSELERQLSQLTEQRLQHLEKLQQQQLEMQSHFISSAIKVGKCPHEPAVPVNSHVPAVFPPHVPLHHPGKTASLTLSKKAEVPHVEEITNQLCKSPLETPAPRRFAPVPISKDVQVPQTDALEKENVKEPTTSADLGKGILLQKILGDGSAILKSASKDYTRGNLADNYRRPYNDSFDLSLMDPATGPKSISVGTSSIANTAVQKANDVLYDLGKLKREMNGMLQEAKQWKSQVDEIKPREQSSLSYFSSVLHKPQPALLKSVNPQKSMVEDAERILREVQSNKKVLEANLEAIIRAKDGASMYSLINTLTTNSNAAEKIRIRKDVDSWIAEMSLEIQEEMARKDNGKKLCSHRPQDSVLRRKAGSTKDVNTEKAIKALGKTTATSTKPSTRASGKTQPKQSEGRLAGPLSKKEPVSQTVPKKDFRSKVAQSVSESAQPDEDILNQIYGKPIYQGHRSTLRKGPYLRFNSPSPKSKPRRPKVLETVRGVKLKSAKVQTSSSEVKTTVTKPVARTLYAPAQCDPQYVFSPSSKAPDVSAPLEGCLIPMAIPLGRSQYDGISPMPASVILAQPQTTTVNVSIPPSSPKLRTKAAKPNIAVIEMKSEKKDPPQLTFQVLPCVDIDSLVSESSSIASERTNESQRAPSQEATPLPPVPAKPDIQLPECAESEEDVLAIPGRSFVQDTDIQEDESDLEIPEPLLELNGCTEPVPPQYNGIPFPPPASAPQVTTDILEGIINRKETLENRLISWVEQEIMARVINEMHPVRQEIVPEISLSSSEDSSSVKSDIVETAGGEGFQLFVDAGVPVDSSLIRKYVDEALAETIAVMLGEREARNAQAPPSRELELQVSVDIPTVPTPECTPPASPLPPVKEPSILRTPELSPQTSVAETESQQEHGQGAGLETTASPVQTPIITPVASPPRVATPTPLISLDSEDRKVTESPSPPNPWGSMDLPLEEENPHSVTEEPPYKDAVVMTVAEDEEPASLISAHSPVSDKSSVSLAPQPKAPSPVPSPSSAPSTEESSLTVTSSESDTVDRPISEGEVLYDYGQIVAARALAENGLVLPNFTESLSSTLRDAHEMEFDPPSEGQVIHGPQRGALHDPVLSLLVNLNQNPVVPLDVYYHPESSEEENSMGEISEGQRPRLTTAAEQVLVGHSAFMGRPVNGGQIAGHQRRRPSSPGQYNKIPGPNQGDSDQCSSGPLSIGDLKSHLMDAHYPGADSSSNIPAAASSTPQAPAILEKTPQPAQTRFIQVGVKTGDDPHKVDQEDLDRTLVEPSVYLRSPLSDKLTDAPKRMLVTVPSADEAEPGEDIQATLLESDSSGADTF